MVAFLKLLAVIVATSATLAVVITVLGSSCWISRSRWALHMLGYFLGWWSMAFVAISGFVAVMGVWSAGLRWAGAS